jgi:hypothetical protein
MPAPCATLCHGQPLLAALEAPNGTKVLCSCELDHYGHSVYGHGTQAPYRRCSTGEVYLYGYPGEHTHYDKRLPLGRVIRLPCGREAGNEKTRRLGSLGAGFGEAGAKVEG